MDFLVERLHVEEAKQTRFKEEKKVTKRLKRETNNRNHNGGNLYNGSQIPKREDRSHLRCSFPDCRKIGHTEATCWTKDPSKIPRSSKNRITDNMTNKLTDDMSGTTTTNHTTFRDTYRSADDLGTAPFLSPSPALHTSSTNTSPQMRSVKASRDLQESGEAVASNSKIKESDLAKRIMRAFLPANLVHQTHG
ncbi:hypothetical protein MRB53_038328 [Persea americana]|nr:hypothetical protein MRB53_038328 [Persea americana]